MTAIAVVIPAHNEEALLTRCLTSVVTAAATAAAACDGLKIEIVLALDACTDRSEAIARRWPVTPLRVHARQVGTARRVGVEYALDRFSSTPRSDLWLANSDADSSVPPHWLTSQWELMQSGVDVMLGTVRPDFADLTRRHAEHWMRTHPRGRPTGKIYGANIGIRASTYVAAGGFPDADEHEDVRLVERAIAIGAVAHSTDVCEVLTSGRFEGRTPGGYAASVRRVHGELESTDGAA